MTFETHLLSFLRSLKIDRKLGNSVSVLNPYLDPYTFSLCEAFYRKYYHDNNDRVLLLGINPGRFGSGTTGISFTDPIKLETICGIPNRIQKKPELSADFIYAMINRYGGPEAFFGRFVISAVSPLGFTRDGKNLNYYDIPALQKAVTPFIVESLSRLISGGINREKCFCIGEGKNLKFLQALNKEQKWFGEIVPLAHPRFIMQYRRRKVEEYVLDYVSKLGSGQGSF